MKRNNIKKLCTLLILGITIFSKAKCPIKNNLGIFTKSGETEPISIYRSQSYHDSTFIYSNHSQIEPISIY